MGNRNINSTLKVGSFKGLAFKIFAILMSLILSFSSLSLTPAYAKEEIVVSPRTDSSGVAGSKSANSNPESKSTKSVKPLATNNYFLDLPQYVGSATVSGTVTNSTSNYPNIATYENGKILAHAQGIAIVTLNMQGGDTNVYHISSYYVYPQSKTAVVYNSAAGERFHKWAKLENNTDYEGSDTLKA